MNELFAPPVADPGSDLAHEPDFPLGSARVRPSLCLVEIGGRAEHLEPRVMQVLVALARSGRTLSREDLAASCWDGRIVGDDALNRCIAKLRRLAALADPPAFHIETVPRVGFRLTTPVPFGEPGETPLSPSDAAKPPPSTAEGPGGVRARWRTPVVAAVVVGLLVISTVAVLDRRSAVSPDARASIAVLPFADLSSTQDQEYSPKAWPRRYWVFSGRTRACA